MWLRRQEIGFVDLAWHSLYVFGRGRVEQHDMAAVFSKGICDACELLDDLPDNDVDRDFLRTN